MGGHDGRTAAPRRAGISSRADAGKNLRHADQEPGEPARPRARLFARRRLRVPRYPGRPEGSGHSDVARQPGCGNHQRLRRTRSRQYRGARRQAGDGRQGLSVQEVRRHRRVRHRSGRERSGQAGRDRGQPGADLRRNQPRGHQGPGVLLHRAGATGAHEDTGVPRRSARHRNHRRGGRPQWPRAGRQEHQQREDRLLRRRCGGHRLP